MTFSEWYSANVEPGVIQTVNSIPDKAARELTLKAARDSMATCWNAALQAADVQMERILRQATEPQTPPIADLSAWIVYYRMLLKNSRRLIEAK